MGIQGGITYWMQDDNSVDIAVEFSKTSITDEGWNGTEAETFSEDDGFGTLAARGRFFYNYTDDIQLVPFFEFSKDNRGVKQDTAAEDPQDDDHETDKVETTTIDVALGINHFPTEMVQLVVAGGIRLTSKDSTGQGEKVLDNNDKHIPYVKGGIDAEIRSWLDLRAGVEKQMTSIKNTTVGGTDPPETKISGAEFQGYIGAGIHLGDWTIDTQVDPNIFYRGPHFISGSPANLNTRVSLVRPW